MSTPNYQALSNQLRLYYAALPREVQIRFLSVLQVTFNVKNRRNAQLWVTQATVRRDFITPSTPALELEMREAFVKGLINETPPSTIQKITELGIDSQKIGKKLRQYLAEDFTRESVTTIEFLLDETLYIYDADSSAFDEIDDDASDEWSDIPTDPEPEPLPEEAPD